MIRTQMQLPLAETLRRGEGRIFDVRLAAGLVRHFEGLGFERVFDPL